MLKEHDTKCIIFTYNHRHDDQHQHFGEEEKNGKKICMKEMAPERQILRRSGEQKQMIPLLLQAVCCEHI